MSRQVVSLREAVAVGAGTGILATATVEDLGATYTLAAPPWARHATIVADISAMSGAGETFDMAAWYLDPIDRTTAVAYPGSGITQVVAAGMVILHIGPFGGTDDDTGPIYYLNSPLMGLTKLVTTLGTTAVHEIQTINLGDAAAADTFKIATAAGGTAKTATIAWHTTGATLASNVSTALNAVLGTGSVTVASTGANAMTATFNKNYNPPQLQVTDTATFSEKTDGGYTTGVITTQAATVGDESYTYNLSVTYTD